MKSRIVAAATLMLLASAAQGASTLSRSDEPVVLAGAQVGSLQGIAPADLVAFRFGDDGWEQIPVQVDERHMKNLRDVYPRPFSCNANTQCFDPGNRVLNVLVYSDPATYSGADTDAALDADDEVVFMVSDAGGEAPAGTRAPSGVLHDSGIQIKVGDSLDGGEGYVYLFKRDSDAVELLESAAGKKYVEYVWNVLSIINESTDYKNPQNHPTNPGYKFGGGWNPEDSYVQTSDYRRGFSDRWYDHELRIYRGGASGVDILDRHDASLTYDEPFTCLRQVKSFAQGEGAFVANINGPVRAIRDYVGANSGPLVQRRHIFYKSKEVIDTYLRVHVVPGPTDFVDYNANAVGLEYKHWMQELPGAIIDGTPDVVPSNPAFLPRTRSWETVDSPENPLHPAIVLLGLQGKLPDSPQGGLTYVHYLDTNNPDSTSRLFYRDNEVGTTDYCNGDGSGAGSERAKLYGSHGFVTSPLMLDTDAGSNTYLYYQRTIYFEAPGTANGPLRTSHESTPLTSAAAPAGLGPSVIPDTTPDAFSFTSLSGVAQGSVVSSNVVTISGIDAPAPIGIAVGEYRINGGGWTSASGEIVNGQTVQVRHTSANAPGTTVESVLTIGGVQGKFRSTTAGTAGNDTDPNPFTFGTKTNQAADTQVASDAITLSGYDAPAPVTAGSGTQYSLDCSGTNWTSAPGTLNVGQSICVRHTTASGSNALRKTSLKVGTVVGYFTTRTAP
jgi:hypothetical protein